MFHNSQLIPYALVALLGAVAPGPDFALVTRYASRWGRRAGLLAAGGVASGMAVNTAAAVLGLGAVLAASPKVYTVVRLIGAVYLLYLGIRLVVSILRVRRDGVPSKTEPESRHSARTAFWRGFVVNILNPKAMVFLVALMPQFLPQSPAMVDRAALGVITVLVVLLWFVVVALGFSLLRRFFEQPRARRALDAVTAIVLIGLGVKIALD
ncbi:LysE family translocator [Catellatospora vulcania]|uniref:LysE family translocator n=1 Tax=Catellatospora vulcania TaxID=1460450 RepID=UPI0012D38BA8|nr:LysE family translocator [Catellatospora vulcania]